MASSTEAVSTPAIAEHPVRVRAALLLGTLGVVFGDIGTSPIYAFRESLKAAGGASEAVVLARSPSFSGPSSWSWRSNTWSSS
jgi:KUP system potassium uptake protein